MLSARRGCFFEPSRSLIDALAEVGQGIYEVPHGGDDDAHGRR